MSSIKYLSTEVKRHVRRLGDKPRSVMPGQTPSSFTLQETLTRIGKKLESVNFYLNTLMGPRIIYGFNTWADGKTNTIKVNGGRAAWNTEVYIKRNGIEKLNVPLGTNAIYYVYLIRDGRITLSSTAPNATSDRFALSKIHVTATATFIKNEDITDLRPFYIASKADISNLQANLGVLNGVMGNKAVNGLPTVQAQSPATMKVNIVASATKKLLIGGELLPFTAGAVGVPRPSTNQTASYYIVVSKTVDITTGLVQLMFYAKNTSKTLSYAEMPIAVIRDVHSSTTAITNDMIDQTSLGGDTINVNFRIGPHKFGANEDNSSVWGENGSTFFREAYAESESGEIWFGY